MHTIDAKRVLIIETDSTIKRFMKKWRLFKRRKSMNSLAELRLSSLMVPLTPVSNEKGGSGKLYKNPTR